MSEQHTAQNTEQPAHEPAAKNPQTPVDVPTTPQGKSLPEKEGKKK